MFSATNMTFIIRIKNFILQTTSIINKSGSESENALEDEQVRSTGELEMKWDRKGGVRDDS